MIFNIYHEKFGAELLQILFALGALLLATLVLRHLPHIAHVLALSGAAHVLALSILGVVIQVAALRLRARVLNGDSA